MNVAFIGKAGAGKDFAASYLVSNFAYQRVAFADALKVEAFTMLTGILLPSPDTAIDWINERKHLPAMRAYLQAHGVAKREFNEPDYWICQAFLTMALYEATRGPQSWVVTDCRFQNEAETLREAGFYLVRIDRWDQPDLEDGLGEHVSETDQDSIGSDFYVHNPGTPDGLYHELDLMIQYLGDLERVRV